MTVIEEIGILKRKIHEFDQYKRQRILEMAKSLEGLIPQEEIPKRIIHDIKKALGEEIESLKCELDNLEEQRHNMKSYVYKVLHEGKTEK